MKNPCYPSLPLLIILIVISPVSAADFPVAGNYTSVDTGTERPYDRFSGQFVLIESFATYCSPCLLEQYELSLVLDAFKDNLTIFSLSVSPSTDSLQDIKLFRAEAEQTHNFKATWEYGLDQDLKFQQKFEIGYLPTTFLFNTQGEIVKRWEGVVSADEIGSYINANVTFPERNQSQELLDTLIGSSLFQITLIALMIAIMYQILIPKPKQ